MDTITSFHSALLQPAKNRIDALNAWAAMHSLAGKPIDWNLYPISALIRNKNKKLIQFFVELGWRPSSTTWAQLTESMAFWLIGVIPNLRFVDSGKCSVLLSLYRRMEGAKPTLAEFYANVGGDFIIRQYTSLSRDHVEFPYFQSLATGFLQNSGHEVPQSITGRLDLVMDWIQGKKEPDATILPRRFYVDRNSIEVFLQFLFKNNCHKVIKQLIELMVSEGTNVQYSMLSKYCPVAADVVFATLGSSKIDVQENAVSMLNYWNMRVAEIPYTTWVKIINDGGYKTRTLFYRRFPRLSISQLGDLNEHMKSEYLSNQRDCYSYLEAKCILRKFDLRSNPWNYLSSGKKIFSKEFKLSIIGRESGSMLLPFTRALPDLITNHSAHEVAAMLLKFHSRKIKREYFYTYITQRVLSDPFAFKQWRNVLRALGTKEATKHELVLKSLW